MQTKMPNPVTKYTVIGASLFFGGWILLGNVFNDSEKLGISDAVGFFSMLIGAIMLIFILTWAFMKDFNIDPRQ